MARTGGPARASHSLVYMLYNQGFVFFNFGYAASIGVILFVAVFILTIIFRKLLVPKFRFLFNWQADQRIPSSSN